MTTINDMIKEGKIQGKSANPFEIIMIHGFTHNKKRKLMMNIQKCLGRRPRCI